MSGWGIVQPSTNCFGAGISLGSPSGEPPSTQLTSVSRSALGSVGLFANLPNCGSANHGGILRWSTASLIALAHGRTCSYVSMENGAAWPGRWHFWQLRCNTGATSLVKVGAACASELTAVLTPITHNSILGIDSL